MIWWGGGHGMVGRRRIWDSWEEGGMVWREEEDMGW